MRRTLFGTDGIRAIAGEAPLDRKTVFAVGRALARKLAIASPDPEVLLGADTRESSPWISGLLAAGLTKEGARVLNAGVITTPGVAYLARRHGLAAGVVVSASHNPWRDNGIKVFGGDGYKLPDEVELSIEEEIFDLLRTQSELPEQPALPLVRSEFRREYQAFLAGFVPHLNLKGMKLVIDCANGASAAIAPELFSHFGGEIRWTNVKPNGRNINENCGALHPEVVARETRLNGADAGVTFDGDADRVLFADAQGHVVNGDAVMLMAARDMQSGGELAGNIVVATTMSNMGLERALATTGIRMLRASVGDKYVLEMMREHKASLGGEQSGHILFSQRSTTGDGLLTALSILDLMQRSSKPLAELCADMKVFPQIIVNVRVREKLPLDQVPAVAGAIQQAQNDLNGCGRVVVRYSGTEALARVMIEAESESRMREHADRIAQAIHSELGQRE